jgi:hypothetical protein
MGLRQMLPVQTKRTFFTGWRRESGRSFQLRNKRVEVNRALALQPRAPVELDFGPGASPAMNSRLEVPVGEV